MVAVALKPSYEPPTLAEEIDRKALEELSRLLLCERQGKISRAQLKECVQTLWNAAAGLVPRQTMDLIAGAVGKTQADQSQALVSVFFDICQGVIVMVSWHVGSDVVRTLMRGREDKCATLRKWVAPHTAIVSSEVAKEQYMRVCDSLRARGYESLQDQK